MENPLNKVALRQKYKLLRNDLSEKRKHDAKQALLNKLYPLLKPFHCILSFASFHGEINLWPLNEKLANEGRLCLPKMENDQIQPFTIGDIKNQLYKTDHGPREPNAKMCRSVAKEKLDCILVPGLCFDQNNNRLGYGLGHFDRFLTGLTIPIYGIGYKEQLISSLPVEPHDVPLTKIYLF